ncbi:NAD-dependent epimerase/dehydratase family protein [Paenibacillus albiflavus]|uniref:NAD-dependent epimerase/dehydratase family protein n=1 Tax=Paenibacillus albiflavus TaxID=2545760 RepID=A0A4R4EFI8_9BACL|nr:NAD-dependent epimerase/dehydratase family protein [Paenibacillus albiflavus]TCZ76855.1 NAD-dependent epimerase/dehydratase family protein [Paenibacillus albiflavus]
MKTFPKITSEDMEFIYHSLSQENLQNLYGSTILVTGYAGSIGYSLLHFLSEYGSKLGIKRVFGIDNYMFGKPKWIERISRNPLFDIRECDVITCDFDFAEKADLIFHMASLASPVYYRLHPIETIDADVTGLRRMLDFYKEKKLKGFLFYSSSEIYGDPHPSQIPTPESYWGNVNTCGPRACYDESKRFGETLCYNYARQYGMPVTIVRPFNNYGPGMRINDQRVVADFAKAVIDNEDIVIFSDGKPTRTFDYLPDAIVGYLKCVLYGKFEIFNIGSDSQELSIMQLAELYRKTAKELFDYGGDIVFKTHEDKEYLTDNPNRRCPDISKAKALLQYRPQIHIEEGIRRYIEYLRECDRCEFEW